MIYILDNSRRNVYFIYISVFLSFLFIIYRLVSL